jgi:hypothetical protein
VVEVAEVGGVDHAGVGAEGVLGAVEVEGAYIFSNHKDGEYDHYLLPIFFASRFHCRKLEYYYPKFSTPPRIRGG